jgi:hypothetical protein
VAFIACGNGRALLLLVCQFSGQKSIPWATLRSARRRQAASKMPRTVTVRELAQSLAIGGDMLAMEGSDTQKTPELIERTTKSSGRSYALEAPHRSASILGAAMVLLKAVEDRASVVR